MLLFAKYRKPSDMADVFVAFRKSSGKEGGKVPAAQMQFDVQVDVLSLNNMQMEQLANSERTSFQICGVYTLQAVVCQVEYLQILEWS